MVSLRSSHSALLQYFHLFSVDVTVLSRRNYVFFFFLSVFNLIFHWPFQFNILQDRIWMYITMHVQTIIPEIYFTIHICIRHCVTSILIDWTIPRMCRNSNGTLCMCTYTHDLHKHRSIRWVVVFFLFSLIVLSAPRWQKW